MKTDEIIKALECCKDRRCDICDRRYGFHAEESICRLDLMEHALYLIGVQKKAIEKQAVNVEALEAGIRREKEKDTERWIPVTERLPDVATVVHGEWEYYTHTMMACSICKRHVPRHKYEYCPHCGAKMDGGEGMKDERLY